MNEAMEKAKFMKKPFTLAKLSRKYIERLWKIGIDVSKFGASIASLFPTITNTLVKAVIRVVGFIRRIRDLSLTRFIFLPPFDLWLRKITPPEEEYFPTEMGRANVSFLFNVTVAKKTATELARRLVAKTPKSALLPRTVPLPEAELIEETVEEPAKTVSHIVTDLQGRFESKLAPSIKSVASALQEYSRQTILLSPLLEMPEPSLAGPAKLEGPPFHPLASPPEKEASQVGLPERPLAVIPQVPPPPRKRAKVEPLPLVSIPVVRLRPEAARSFGYATGLPSIVLEQEVPTLKTMPVFPLVSAPKVEPPLPSAKLPTKMTEPLPSMPVERLRPDVVVSLEYATKLPSIVLEQEIPILKRMVAFSLVSPLKPPLPSVEPTYRFPRPTTLPPMRPSQIDRLLEEISPSLTSWIYGVSEILRGTAHSLSAVPVAASTAERVVTETLVQPVSSLEAPRSLSTKEPVSLGLTPSGPETGVGRIEVEAFRLPAIVASLILALSQRYPLLFSETAIGETWGTSFELTRAAAEETTTLGRMPEVKRFSKLPTVIALAAAKSLIAQRLQHEFGALTREMQVARSSYGERLGELRALGPIRTTMLGKLAAAAPALLPALEPYAPRVPSTPPGLAKVSPVSPTIQNTFNITISAETAEEDLRDLERKISRILSEQIRRYYGSTRI